MSWITSADLHQHGLVSPPKQTSQLACVQWRPLEAAAGLLGPRVLHWKVSLGCRALSPTEMHNPSMPGLLHVWKVYMRIQQSSSHSSV